MAPSTIPKTLVSLRTVGARYEMKPRTLLSWIRRGELRAFKAGKLWRVDPTDVERLIRERPAGSAR